MSGNHLCSMNQCCHCRGIMLGHNTRQCLTTITRMTNCTCHYLMDEEASYYHIPIKAHHVPSANHLLPYSFPSRHGRHLSHRVPIPASHTVPSRLIHQSRGTVIGGLIRHSCGGGRRSCVTAVGKALLGLIRCKQEGELGVSQTVSGGAVWCQGCHSCLEGGGGQQGILC